MIAPIGRTAGSDGRIKQVLFCEPSLAKVGRGQRGAKKVFLYYDTIFSASGAPVSSKTPRQWPSVCYITHAGQLCG